ncbi:MAG: outer membrane protein assembly factor BamE [Gammaproteobacteria bacterium]|nr:MAG: outer membrane protein assembly factor BamE [Gammaproteobacteria bacterium]
MRIILISMALALAGCQLIDPLVYRLTISQGNLIDQEQVDKLSPGMTKEQVRFVLGTPQTQDPFKHDVWNYDFHFINARGQKDTDKLRVYFANNKLVRIEGDFHHPQLNPEAKGKDSS